MKKNRRELMRMQSSLFRKKSLEKISSSEELHNYLRVTSPRLWMILGAIVLLLVGFIVYASTANIENTMPIELEVESFDTLPEYQENGGSTRVSLVTGKLPASLADTVDTGMRVRILGQYEGTVSLVVENEGDLYVSVSMDNEFVPLADGTYEADLVIESTTPISFLWN